MRLPLGRRGVVVHVGKDGMEFWHWMNGNGAREELKGRRRASRAEIYCGVVEEFGIESG